MKTRTSKDFNWRRFKKWLRKLDPENKRLWYDINETMRRYNPDVKKTNCIRNYFSTPPR